jgi:hypothetical protein
MRLGCSQGVREVEAAWKFELELASLSGVDHFREHGVGGR